MIKLLEKFGGIFGYAFFGSMLFGGLYFALNENSKLARDFFNQYPSTTYFFMAPVGLCFALMFLGFILTGFCDLLEYYHKQRTEGASQDAAVKKILKVTLIILVVLIVTWFMWFMSGSSGNFTD